MRLPASECSRANKVKPRIINLFGRKLVTPFQRDSQRQAGIQVFVSCRQAHAGGIEGITAGVQVNIVLDPAVIKEGKSMQRLLFIERRLIRKPYRHALVAADEAFLIAPHAADPAQIEPVCRGAVFVSCQLSVKPRREHLPVFILFLIQHAQLVTHVIGIIFPIAGSRIFILGKRETVLVIENAAVPVGSERDIRNKRAPLIFRPVVDGSPFRLRLLV